MRKYRNNGKKWADQLRSIKEVANDVDYPKKTWLRDLRIEVKKSGLSIFISWKN